MKNLEISLLLDYYGDMLTEKQREVIWLYYNEDLSLAEISQLSGVTRQGVRDSIKRGEAALMAWEEKLQFARRSKVLQEGLEEICRISAQPAADSGRQVEQIARQLLELL